MSHPKKSQPLSDKDLEQATGGSHVVGADAAIFSVTNQAGDGSAQSDVLAADGSQTQGMAADASGDTSASGNASHYQ
ncbi:MAG: hypothetical protein LC737_09700 [Chloroflexi bacterium]|nr:hypothetical protein [Chloroflexota bacterium]